VSVVDEDIGMAPKFKNNLTSGSCKPKQGCGCEGSLCGQGDPLLGSVHCCQFFVTELVACFSSFFSSGSTRGEEGGGSKLYLHPPLRHCFLRFRLRFRLRLPRHQSSHHPWRASLNPLSRCDLRKATPGERGATCSSIKGSILNLEDWGQAGTLTRKSSTKSTHA
jgi:hypothetical protein